MFINILQIFFFFSVKIEKKGNECISTEIWSHLTCFYAYGTIAVTIAVMVTIPIMVVIIFWFWLFWWLYLQFCLWLLFCLNLCLWLLLCLQQYLQLLLCYTVITFPINNQDLIEPTEMSLGDHCCTQMPEI